MYFIHHVEAIQAAPNTPLGHKISPHTIFEFLVFLTFNYHHPHTNMPFKNSAFKAIVSKLLRRDSSTSLAPMESVLRDSTAAKGKGVNTRENDPKDVDEVSSAGAPMDWIPSLDSDESFDVGQVSTYAI